MTSSVNYYWLVLSLLSLFNYASKIPVFLKWTCDVFLMIGLWANRIEKMGAVVLDCWHHLYFFSSPSWIITYCMSLPWTRRNCSNTIVQILKLSERCTHRAIKFSVSKSDFYKCTSISLRGLSVKTPLLVHNIDGK